MIGKSQQDVHVSYASERFELTLHAARLNPEASCHAQPAVWSEEVSWKHMQAGHWDTW